MSIRLYLKKVKKIFIQAYSPNPSKLGLRYVQRGLRALIKYKLEGNNE